MKYKEMKKLVDSIIENEFQHKQEYAEKEYTDSNKEQLELGVKSSELFKRLCEGGSGEFQNLLDDYSSATVNEWVQLCRFYFREGVRAGANNLDFLKESGMGDLLWLS